MKKYVKMWRLIKKIKMIFKKPLFFVILALFSLSFSFLKADQASAQAGPVSSGAGGSDGNLVCLEKPVQIDLKNDLKVEMLNGQPQVILDWKLNKTEDLYQDQKVEAFMSYLEKNPNLGKSQNKLKNVFADHVYNQLSNSENALAKAKFEEALAQTMEGSKLLTGRNIQTLFNDYYPYIFIHQLKNQSGLSTAFLSGLSRGLPGETIQTSELIKTIASSLKQVRSTMAINDTASCMTRVIGSATIDQFRPDTPNSVYGSNTEAMQAIVNTLKEQGKVKPILDSIANDKELVAETKIALKAGINTVIEVWAKNSNVQNLLNFYEEDPEMRKLATAFFETRIGGRLNDCIKDAYKTSLLEVTQEVYLHLAKSELDSEKAYSDEATKIVLQTLDKMLRDEEGSEVQEEAARTVQSFINDYLLLEQEVSQNTKTGAGTPFGDFYRAELSEFVDFPETMIIEIQRDGQVIERLTNPNITHYVDSQVPSNNTDALVVHKYNLVTRTPCESISGQFAQASINPTLKEGTPVKVFADLETKLKDSQTKFFMTRLNVLLKTLVEGKVKFNSESDPTKLGNPAACEASRTALLANKTSDKLIPYVLDCFGDGQINEALQAQMEAILNPLIRFLELNQFTDTDKVTETFLMPIIVAAREEYTTRMEVLKEVQSLSQYAQAILTVENFDDFTTEQRQWIKCGGQTACPEKIKKLMENYLLGASHSADLNVEVYDEAGTFVRNQAAHTDIFGQVTQVSLGELNAGQNYQFKVKLANQPYALAKISQLTILDATPVADQFRTTISLKTDTPFFYGNFDNTNDVIDLKDIEAWSKLVESDPQKWSDYNIDGFAGVDLFDVSLLQNNWGDQAKQVKVTEITLQQLNAIFGYNGGDTSIIYTPSWLLKL